MSLLFRRQSRFSPSLPFSLSPYLASRDAYIRKTGAVDDFRRRDATFARADQLQRLMSRGTCRQALRVAVHPFCGLSIYNPT